jgi:hypothetical protein
VSSGCSVEGGAGHDAHGMLTQSLSWRANSRIAELWTRSRSCRRTCIVRTCLNARLRHQFP